MTNLSGEILPTQWEAVAFRMTAFQLEMFDFSKVDWWSKIAGQNSDKKTESRTGPVLIHEEGLVNPGNLILEIQPDRIDIVLRPKDPDNPATDRMPSLGILDNVLDLFLMYISKWFQLSDIPPINRIAFGAIAQQPVNNREEGYSLLAKYLQDVKIDVLESSDFLYQINRPRKSSIIDNLKINRLSKWSTKIQQGIFLSVAPNVQKTSTYSNVPLYAANCELDINTHQGYKGNFPKARLTDIFKELVAFGKEIIIKGDIK